MQETLLAFDFGAKRIGVAVGSTLLRSAQALKTIAASSDDHRYAEIAALIQQWQPQRLVVGIAYNADGSPHAMTQRCEQFARQLQHRFGLPVARIDERYSSQQAAQQHRTRRQLGLARAGDEIDHLAAAIILERYFLLQEV